MPRQDTPRMNVAHGWLRGEDWWGDPMSDNMVMMDALLHPNVKTLSLNSPPVDTVPGDQYIVGPEPSGLWLENKNAIATRYPDRWRFTPAFKGLRVFVEDLDGFYWFNGETWGAERDGGGGVNPNGNTYDFLCSVGYAPLPGEIVLLAPIPETMTLPKGAVGSIALTLAAPAQGFQLSIGRNGSHVGRITYSSNDFSGTVAVASDVIFTRGDRLTVQVGDNFPSDFGNFSALLRFILSDTP